MLELILMAILEDYESDAKGLLYEVDETGAQELVRSLASTHRVYIRFTNVTSRPVNVWWRDFNGARRFYTCLRPTEFYDINTFTTHPWEFTDQWTGERYNIGNKIIFRAPKGRDDARFRINFNISVSLRTLRDTALLHVALALSKAEQVSSLGLPRELADDLKNLAQVMQRQRQRSQQLE